MTVQRENNEIIIRISDSVKKDDITRLISYIKYLEVTAGAKATQAEVDQLSREVNASWWSRNKDRILS